MQLLHLVSEQVLQNLLPVIALRPAQIVQVLSADPRIAHAAERLRHAVAALRNQAAFADYEPEFFAVEIGEAMPSVDATRRKVGEALSLWPGCTVNLTGGTKLMSIGAWEAAKYERRPVLYCDTSQSRFVFEGPQAPPPIAPFADATAHLDVETLLASAGLDRTRIRFEEATPALHAFAAAVGCVPESWQRWAAAELARFFPEGRLAPKGRIRGELEQPLGDPPAELGPALRAAQAAGLLHENLGSWFLSPAPGGFAGNSNALQRAAEDHLRLLQGGWFELFVEEALRNAGTLRDLRRGLATARDTAFGETDFVAIDPRHVCLVVISCKTGDTHVRPLEHLSELRERAQRLGGPFARSALILGRSDNPNKLADLVAFARALKIGIYLRDAASGRIQPATADLPDPLHLPPRS